MPSRRKLIKMTDEERSDYLANARTLIVVSNGVSGFPHPVPMWYYVDQDGVFYCTTFGKSQKVENWKRDPRASLLIESGEEYAELRGVVVYAHTEVIKDCDVVVDTLVNINSKNRDLSEEQHQTLRSNVSGMANKRVALKFTPEHYVSWDHTKLGGHY